MVSFKDVSSASAQGPPSIGRDVLSALFAPFVERKDMVIFQLTAGVEKVFLKFQDGLLIDAVSSCSPVGQRLGEILVAQGALTIEKLEEFLAGSVNAGAGRIGDRLLNAGLISPADLSRARASQVQQLFQRLADSPHVSLTITR